MTATRPARPFKRALIASISGQALEWYDFYLYGLAAALVFPHVFFPGASDFVGLLASFGTFAVGFVARPVGGLVFGRLGDRIGRSPTLVITILVMGLGTVAIGLLPTYDQVGVISPILLVLLRVVQGIGVGGEWSGSAVLVLEYAPEHRRGFFSSMINSGEYIGTLPAAGLFTLMSATMSDASFSSWGWRIPFLVSVLAVVGSLIIRRAVEETPAFQAVQGEGTRPPSLRESLRSQWRSVATVVGLRILENASAYLITAFAVTYAETTGHASSTVTTLGVFLASAVAIPMIPLWGYVSDLVGRKKVFAGGACFMLAFYVPFFLLVGSGQTGPIWLAFMAAYAFGMAPMLSVEPSWFAELFPTEFRFSGTAISSNVGAVFAGGLAPFIATALFGAGGDSLSLVYVYIGMLGLVTITAIVLARETRSLRTVAYAAVPEKQDAQQEPH
ncbi:MHS family MFS transporter [Amycolatopsis acidicola]|uniref:Putative proline/betaine transporter n=1 Tax=Amycolatopsis acidicola TaxID=2596893 RepID=A0A5N0VH72_9PSEU|nr:MFS transporter [Amycolatopsis acidicola]KAA9164022.1 MHS family MFS transporter [Amycolatopsis acidicola]